MGTTVHQGHHIGEPEQTDPGAWTWGVGTRKSSVGTRSVTLSKRKTRSVDTWVVTPVGVTEGGPGPDVGSPSYPDVVVRQDPGTR